MWPHRRQPTRLPHPWDSPGKNTGVGCHFLLQCMKVKNESEVAQSCPTLSDPMNCSLPGSSVHGIFQARVLEWGAIAFSDPLAIVNYKSAFCHYRFAFSGHFIHMVYMEVQIMWSFMNFFPLSLMFSKFIHVVTISIIHCILLPNSIPLCVNSLRPHEL